MLDTDVTGHAKLCKWAIGSTKVSTNLQLKPHAALARIFLLQSLKTRPSRATEATKAAKSSGAPLGSRLGSRHDYVQVCLYSAVRTVQYCILPPRRMCCCVLQCCLAFDLHERCTVYEYSVLSVLTIYPACTICPARTICPACAVCSACTVWTACTVLYDTVLHCTACTACTATLNYSTLTQHRKTHTTTAFYAYSTLPNAANARRTWLNARSISCSGLCLV